MEGGPSYYLQSIRSIRLILTIVLVAVAEAKDRRGDRLGTVSPKTVSSFN